MKHHIIGCGGITNWLLPPLCMYLNYTAEGSEIHLVDGDVYEERNKDRQTFNIRGNKATVTAQRLREQYLNLFYWPHPVYITETNSTELIRDGDLFFLCVDNHKTRKLVSDRCQELDNVTLISGGNDYTDGNIQVFIRENGVDMTLPIANKYHGEIQNPVDKNPGDEERVVLGCEAQIPTEPQLVITNMAIAALMLNCYYARMTGTIQYDEVYTDVLTNKSRPVNRREAK